MAGASYTQIMESGGGIISTVRATRAAGDDELYRQSRARAERMLAAGTTTGGMTNKRFGRVGDSPIIGAGTYADNATCAVSSTGWGEYFIRGVIAHDIAAMMEYGGTSVGEAARTVIMEKLEAMGGTGGVIAMDREGHVAMPFNTEGMYRGRIDAEGNVTVEIYKD